MGGNHPRKKTPRKRAAASSGTPPPMQDAEYETVARPKHYAVVGDFDVIDIIKAQGMGFELGNALKYVMRAGKKPGVDADEDIKKAIYYLRRYIGEVS